MWVLMGIAFWWEKKVARVTFQNLDIFEASVIIHQKTFQ